MFLEASVLWGMITEECEHDDTIRKYPLSSLKVYNVGESLTVIFFAYLNSE